MAHYLRPRVSFADADKLDGKGSTAPAARRRRTSRVATTG
jgi:hypothetical protein